MTGIEINEKLDSIIDELNDMEAEEEDLELSGAVSVEMALDFLRDDYEGEGEFSPSEEEIAKIVEIVDKNVKKLNENEARRIDLKTEYFEIANAYPHYYDFPRRYSRNWLKEKF